MLNADKIILEPVVSEKAALATSKTNTYSFRVSDASNKVSIAQAVETAFPKVDVINVRIINVHPKAKRSRYRRGQLTMKSAYKKALVTIKAGQTLGQA
jgi:large subunit ribosomal protein L23